MTTPVESSNVSMGTLVGQSHMSQVSDRPLSTMVNFIKPGVSSATNSQVLVVRKNSGISSFVQAPTFSGNQLITTRSDGPKIVNVPMASVQNSTKITSLDGTTQFAIAKNAGVKVVWPSNLTPGLLPVKQIAPNSNSKNAQPIAIKRTVAPSLGNQVITKVIITNNSSNQSVTPVSVSANVSGTGSALHTQQSLLSSPSKTITLSRNLMNIAGTQQMVKTTTTPANKGVYLLSPVKPLPKIATVPSSLMKSPRRIAPATSTFSSLVTSSKLSTVAGSIGTTTPAITKTITVPQSPKKILLKTVGGNLASVLASTPVTPSQMQSTGMGGQHMQIPGNNVHFVRLVSAPSSSTTNTTIANKQTTLMSNTTTTTTVPSLPTITVTSQMCKTAALAKQALKIKPAQKLLIPAPTSSSHGGTSGTLTNTQIGQLASGTLIPIVGSGQGYVVVPANYMSQTQQASQSSQNAPVVIQNILPAPVISTSGGTASSISSGIETSANTSANFLLSSAANQVISHHVSKYMNGRMPTETADSRPRKPCNCTKSQCLKLYCDCFASGEFCNGCNCNNCYNNLQHEEERQKAIKSCLDRNRMAFHPKIGKSREGDTERRHTKGCHCKRSGCLKNYCECYEAKILCTDLCKCIGCKNFEDSYERKTLMHLADAAEVRVQQQAAAITNFTADIFEGLPRPQFNLNRGAPLPISFVNEEVIEATVACLLARAHQAEKQRKSAEETEKALVEEFGLCLMSIISRSKQQQEMCSDADSNS